MKRRFNLFWKTGEVQTIEADDTGETYATLANAISNAGIGGGALAALDYWREVKDETAVNAAKDE